MATSFRSFSTNLDLPQIPNNVPDELREEFQRIYNAIFALALKIDTFVVLSRGMYLIDTQPTPHYWLITVSNVGALVVTDTGTNPPT